MSGISDSKTEFLSKLNGTKLGITSRRKFRSFKKGSQLNQVRFAPQVEHELYKGANFPNEIKTLILESHDNYRAELDSVLSVHWTGD